MPLNWYMLFIAAFIPMIVGAIWYGPIFGKKWMNVNGFSEEDLKGGNMVLILGLSYLFSVFMAFAVTGIAIHQTGAFQMMAPDIMESGSQAQQLFNDLMAQYGDRYRSFGHGALHGGFLAAIFVFPMIAINALFERRGWAYIGIHSGYWFVTLLLMGGLLCATIVYPTLQ